MGINTCSGITPHAQANLLPGLLDLQSTRDNGLYSKTRGQSKDMFGTLEVQACS